MSGNAMNIWLRLALASAWSRRLPVLLVLLAVATSSLLVLFVSQLRADLRTSFGQAISGVDLLVAPRGSPTEILLYGVFQLGRPTQNLDAAHLERVRGLTQVEWAVPVQLGDTYRGRPVWGTEADFFSRVQVRGQPLRLAEGKVFSAATEAVLGAEVAKHLAHRLGDRLLLTHGRSDGLSRDHDDHPFEVVGVLAPTGGPLDRAVFISTQGFESIHQGWLLGALATPSSYTTLWVGLQNRGQVFSARRAIESLPGAPLTAALPGVTLDELWRTLSVVERGFALVGWAVSIGALLSVAAMTLVSLASRRREFAILRAVGAGPAQVAWLILLEATLVGLAGVLLGLCIQQAVVWWFADFLRIEYGVAMSVLNLPPQAWLSLLGLGMASVAISLLPAWRARRLSLVDGLHPPVA
ncbi:MAG: hypothetical protein RIR74_386 [Pseudomonadota bacterium]